MKFIKLKLILFHEIYFVTAFFWSVSKHSLIQNFRCNHDLQKRAQYLKLTIRDDDDESKKGVSKSPVLKEIKLINGGKEFRIGVIVRDDDPSKYILPFSSSQNEYVMIDIPSFSKELYSSVKSFIGEESKIIAILITNNKCINSKLEDKSSSNDDGNIMRRRTSDLGLWKEALENVAVIMHRADIPRDEKKYISQVLDGFGPWGFSNSKHVFEETGRPLTIIEWDDDKLDSFIKDDLDDEEEKKLTKLRIEKEIDKNLLAMYTPGHTIGSMCYIFPFLGVCCSGFAIPISSNVLDVTRLDYKGFITTNRAGVKKQFTSVEELMDQYGMKFDKLLPSTYGQDNVFLIEGQTHEDRVDFIMVLMNQFLKVGEMYESLGIVSRKKQNTKK